MSSIRYTITSILIISTLITFAQNQKKHVEAIRTKTPPHIDGILNDTVWKGIPVATDFVQIRPYNGEPSIFNTEVKFIYDDDAIYLAALMYDPNPDSICVELTKRDQIENDDFFGVYLDPFNDAQTAYGFFITAAGVQVDMRANISGWEDESWDGVWYSAVNINEEGWSVEYKIPYSALRFPEKVVQTWGMNLIRNIRRLRQHTSWNLIDVKESGFINQQGELLGIENITPPLRLSFFPYVSGYIEQKAGEKKWTPSYNMGMDLKYGINESFTLDLTLIPDFGQVQSDDIVFNFSPFEIYYSEKRPFFTEGTELFERHGVFYTRRIGDKPQDYEDIKNTYAEDSIIENPQKNQLLNAVKISGKTGNNLGIGFFNAITSASHAKVIDSAGKKKEILTQPLTNYNMIVFDKSLNNNSSIGFYNTNVFRGINHKTANVTGVDWQLRNKKNKYQFKGHINVSQKYSNNNKPDVGFKYNASVGKISGNFLAEYSQNVENDKYDPNDLGFLRNNNEFSHNVELEYNIYDPFWIVNEWYNDLDIWYSSLYAPREYTEFGFDFRTRVTFKNYLTFGSNFGAHPFDGHDYYEPRVDGWYFAEPPLSWIGFFFSPDYRKKFVVDVNYGVAYGDKYKSTTQWAGLRPRYRINDNLTISYNFDYSKQINNLGYVTDSTYKGDEKIIFGKRNILNITNTLNTVYIFTNKSSLSFRLRHYWVKTKYNQFYDLLPDGDLRKNNYSENENFSFNAFNIDMVFKWNFSPGSEFLLVWKNAIYTQKDVIEENFFDNLRNTIESPATNSFSIKIMYYLDYHYLKKAARKII